VYDHSVITAREHRQAHHAIDPLFLDRWSPRAMTGQPISPEELLPLFEAARWAPSSGNQQPWRMLYAHRDAPAWSLFYELLNPGNKSWCANAAVLVVFISRTVNAEGRPIRTHSYDTGAAWENFALQGTKSGLVVHGMQGFNYDQAREVLQIPEDFAVEAMAAVGRPGRKEDLSESLQAREIPSTRRPLVETIVEGPYRN
jgi:nitroreductase